MRALASSIIAAVAFTTAGAATAQQAIDDSTQLFALRKFGGSLYLIEGLMTRRARTAPVDAWTWQIHEVDRPQTPEAPLHDAVATRITVNCASNALTLGVRQYYLDGALVEERPAVANPNTTASPAGPWWDEREILCNRAVNRRMRLTYPNARAANEEASAWLAAH